MSISAVHASAARENGAKSQGPVSPEGKARSAQNARKHGLFAAINIVDPEEKQQFDELLQAYLDEYGPATLDEHRCIREMVNAEWRLAAIRRAIDAIQLHNAKNISAPAGLEIAFAFQKLADTGQALNTALRYERQFQRQFDKARAQLLEMRRAARLDRDTIARRTDQEMMNILHSIANAPLPQETPALNKNLRNEPKQLPVAQSSSVINPTINVRRAPESALPNLFRG